MNGIVVKNIGICPRIYVNFHKSTVAVSVVVFRCNSIVGAADFLSVGICQINRIFIQYRTFWKKIIKSTTILCNRLSDASACTCGNKFTHRNFPCYCVLFFLSVVCSRNRLFYDFRIFLGSDKSVEIPVSV